MDQPPSRRRSTATIVLTAFLALLSGNAIAQAVGALLGSNTDPGALTAFQLASGGSALAAAAGTWRSARWAPLAAVLYGLVTGIMIVSLGPMLELDETARRGLPAGGAGVLCVGLLLAWFIRRSQRADEARAAFSPASSLN